MMLFFVKSQIVVYSKNVFKFLAKNYRDNTNHYLQIYIVSITNEEI